VFSELSGVEHSRFVSKLADIAFWGRMVGMRRMVVALACVLFVSSVARGEGAQPIRVYTNADLDALPPLPPTGTIHEPRPASEDWKFVMEFIDRERSRLDDERRLRLEQRIADTELDAIRDPRPSYGPGERSDRFTRARTDPSGARASVAGPDLR
jgi:hypothetical protein